MFANQEMVHGKIATCDTKTMEDTFIVKVSGAPKDRMFPKSSEVTQMGSLYALEICIVNLELWPLNAFYLFGYVKGL